MRYWWKATICTDPTKPRSIFHAHMRLTNKISYSIQQYCFRLWPLHVWSSGCSIQLVGLDLFNNDTYPSGYISRPSHVGVSHICLSSTKRSGGVVWLRILSVANSFKSRVVLDIWPFISDVVYMKLKKFPQFRDCSSEGFYRTSDRSYQVEESRFSQEFRNGSPMNCLKESIQWVSCVVFVTTFP